jgi:hypothetical protein
MSDMKALRAVLVAVALASLVVGGAAAAGFIDGNKLFADCQGGDDPRERQQGDPGGLSEWGQCLGGGRCCPFRKSYPDVLVVQSSQNRNGDDGASALNCSMQWHVLL